MAPKRDRILSPIRTLAENTALLFVLSRKVALPPSSNPMTEPSTRDTARRSLTFERERKLTEILAFLAKVDDKPDHVMAVCVEEQPTGPCLVVRVAINKSSPAYGDVALQKVKIGFEKIFKILSQGRITSGWL
jgi:hypothetical protein